MKKGLLITALCGVLAVGGAGGYLFVAKPMLTVKKAVEALGAEDGTYKIKWSTKADGTAPVGYCNLAMEREDSRFMGTVVQCNDSTIGSAGFYYDYADASVLINVGSVADSLLPEGITSILQMFGLADKLNEMYISGSQLDQFTGVENTAFAVLGEQASVLPDVVSVLSAADSLSAVPVFNTKEFVSSGIVTEEDYLLKLKQDKLAADVYVGCSKASDEAAQHVILYIDYADAAAVDQLFIADAEAHETTVEMPESSLTDEQVANIVNMLSNTQSSLSTLTGFLSSLFQ